MNEADLLIHSDAEVGHYDPFIHKLACEPGIGSEGPIIPHLVSGVNAS